MRKPTVRIRYFYSMQIHKTKPSKGEEDEERREVSQSDSTKRSHGNSPFEKK